MHFSPNTKAHRRGQTCPRAIILTTEMGPRGNMVLGRRHLSAGLRNACPSVKTFVGSLSCHQNEFGEQRGVGVATCEEGDARPLCRHGLRGCPEPPPLGNIQRESESGTSPGPPSKAVSARPPWEMSFLLKRGGLQYLPLLPHLPSRIRRIDVPHVATFSGRGEPRGSPHPRQLSDLLCSPVTSLSRCCQMLGCERLALGAPRTEGTAPARRLR